MKRSLVSCLILLSIGAIILEPRLHTEYSVPIRISLVLILIYLLYFVLFKTGRESRIAESFNTWLKGYRTNLDTHFCLYIMVQTKGLFSSCIDHQQIKKLYRKISYELEGYFGKANVQRIGFDAFTVLREFPTPNAGNAIEKTEYQRIVTRTICERLLKVVQHTEEKSSAQFDITIGCAASGLRYHIDKLEQLIDLAYFAAMQAKEKQDPFLVADEMIRARKLDIDECKQGFLSLDWENEFNPFFQPIIDPQTFEVIGIESLARWQLGGFRILEAKTFKDVAQELSHIATIDDTIITKTFGIVRSMMVSKLIPYDFKIVLNISNESLSSHFCKYLQRLITRYGLQATQIELDIHDSALSDTRTAAILEACKKAGFRISLDVFNKNSFDLYTFMNADINTLKLDFASFTPQLQQVYRALKETATSMGIEVLAKGIETKETLASALALECEYLQGNYFTPPIARPTFEIFMNKYKQGLYTEEEETEEQAEA